MDQDHLPDTVVTEEEEEEAVVEIEMKEEDQEIATKIEGTDLEIDTVGMREIEVTEGEDLDLEARKEEIEDMILEIEEEEGMTQEIDQDLGEALRVSFLNRFLLKIWVGDNDIMLKGIKNTNL